jgi:hypothetical protein
MKFKKGDLFEVLISNQLNVTSDGFATGRRLSGSIVLFEYIDVVTYPSCNDFFGKETLAREGIKGTVIKYIGRPIAISRNPVWFNYNIYEVLILGDIRQIFQQNMRAIV